MKSRQALEEDEIADLCERHRCSEKKRKIHLDQFVNRGWHPHAPESFVDWWHKHPDFKNSGGSLDAKRAYNCQRYRSQFAIMPAETFARLLRGSDLVEQASDAR